MLELKNNTEKYKLSSKELNIEILKSGDIFKIYKNDIQINLFKGNLLDGAINNIYLRRKKGNTYNYSKLIGVDSPSSFLVLEDKVVYKGETFGINYQVILKLLNNIWYYNVKLDKGTNDDLFDIIFVQDIGVAPSGMIQSSEAYTGQYVDHNVFSNENKTTILFRQNQGVPNLVQIGSFNNITSYATDGFQFYGLTYKETNIPESLLKEKLVSQNYQYEFPLAALQTEPFKLDSSKEFTFYGMYVENYEEIRKEPFEINNITFDNEVSGKYLKFENKIEIGKPLVGLSGNDEHLVNSYNDVRHIEKDGSKLLSFFAGKNKHIVTKAKELLVERPHGQVLIHGDILNASESVMATTGHMYGVFSSHIVLGNTNFHKLTGDVRNKLNVQKISGQRIYLEINNKYHLLTMPSYFEINTNNLKWIYILENDVIEVNYLTSINKLGQRLSFKSKNNIKYNLIVTQQIIMGERENTHEIDFLVKDNEVLITTLKNQMVLDAYPNLKYKYISSGNVEVLDDKLFFGKDSGEGLLIFKYQKTNNFFIDVFGTYEDEFDTNVNFEKEAVEKESLNFFKQLTPLKVVTNNENINSFNDLSIWYTQNALVHYSSPHGLEQFNGAAWGTRDVMQGPFELFITTQRYDLAKNIILRTFERQFDENGDFPQWFMFDNYYRIQAHDSHADIIVWPLKALADYLEVTGDVNILEQLVSYMSLKNNDFTKEKYNLIHHINKALDRIRSTEIKGIPLPAYGGGDWNDTLQPANHALTEKMVSTWTVALLYESLNKLFNVLPKKYETLIERIRIHKEDISKNYYKYLVKDDIPAGFTIFEDDKVRYLLHPDDKTTNLNYRLLSFNQSISSELADKSKINDYLKVMDKHLKHPDGMHLMDKAITYNGGKNTYFARAETAANFGREVGLNYIHAHLRYIESMAKIGDANRTLEGLIAINPINITKNVANALPRQSNTYFSSSDGDFLNRYDAQENFDKLRTGKVGVKAGWRLYSSGPGIYLNQVISNTFGIRNKQGDLVLDPVLNDEFNNSTLYYKFLGKDIIVKYLKSNKEKLVINDKEVDPNFIENKFKNNSILIKNEQINKLDQIIIEYHYI